MKLSFAVGSILLFALSVAFLVIWTSLDSALVGLSLVAERIIALLLLVLPTAVGALMGIVSLRRREGRNWLAIAGIGLNTLFALFHLALVLFGG